jgi:hypothetical protein
MLYLPTSNSRVRNREGMVSRSVVDMLLILKILKVGLCPIGSSMYRPVLIMFIMKRGFNEERFLYGHHVISR